MKGKRFLAGLLTAAMLITSPAVTRAALVDDDFVNLNEIEQTEEPETEEPAINPAEKSGYETDWDKLKDEISNAISTFSSGGDEEPVVEDGALKAASGSGGASVTNVLFEGIGKYKLNWVGGENYHWDGNAGALQMGIDAYKVNISDKTNGYDATKRHVNEASDKRKAAAARILGLSTSTKDKTAAKKIYNSSNGAITASDNTSGIYKAYLVWQSRGSQAGTVALVRPDGTAKKVTKSKVYNDIRSGGSYVGMDGKQYSSAGVPSMYNYVADVTSFVKKDASKGKGYGTYSVCNMAPWVPDGHGGGSSCRWQLIFVEKSTETDKLSAVNVRIGSYFTEGPDESEIGDDGKSLITMDLDAPENLSFPKNTSLQVVLGADSSTDSSMQATVTIGGKKVALGKNYSKPGLWKEDEKPKAAYTDASFSLTKGTAGDKSGKKATVEFRVFDTHWRSYYLLGAVIDFNFPFSGNQETIVNETSNPVSATVKDTIVNKVTAGNGKLGIYDGTVTVDLDSKLTANTASGQVYKKDSDGVYQKEGSLITGSIDNENHTVTFSGVNLKTKAYKFDYTIDCTPVSPGVYNNSDEYGGKLWNDNESKAADKKTGKDMGIVYNDTSDKKWTVETIEIRYHLNATNEASAETVDELVYTSFGDPRDTTFKNDPNATTYPYTIRSYDDVGFYANDGYMPGMANVDMGMFWTTTADGSGTRYYPGSVNSTIYPTGNMDLYAHWIPDSYGVVYDANGGTGNKLGSDGNVLPLKDGKPNTGVDKAYFGETYTLLGADSFQRPGYYFTGWNTQANCKGVHYETGDTSKDFTGSANPE